MKRQVFTGRKTFGTADARITIKRKTFDDGRDAVTTLVGYPILWGELSSDRGGYQVRLVKGAATFTKPALALFHHNFAAVLGNTANETLRVLAADDTGVPVEIDLPNTNMGRDVAELVGKKYIQGMSFSMVNGFEDYTEEKQGENYIINVSKFTVDEVTITAIPAFTGTSIDLKPDEDDEDEDEPETAPARVDAASQLRALRLAMLSH